MNLNLDNKEITTQCPKCKGTLKYKLKQIGTSILCPSCKSNILLSDNGFKKGITDLNNVIKKTFK